MRRFEREVNGARRFWEVDLQGTDLTFHTGLFGRPARARTQTERNPEAAAAALARAVSEMVEGGWTEVLPDRPPPSAGDVLPDAGDRAGWHVLADRLQAAGDPRGELMAVQLALEDGEDPALARLEAERLLALGPELLGVPVEVMGRLRWARGFLCELDLALTGYGTQAATDLEFLAERGELRALRVLRGRGDGASDALGFALARRSWPALEVLTLEGALTVPIGRVTAGMPALRDLTVGAFQTVGAALETLTRLDVGVGGDGLTELAELELPALTHLRVRGGTRVDRGALGRLTGRALTELTVDAALWPELAPTLTGPPAWGRLAVVAVRRPAELAEAMLGVAGLLAGVPVRVEGDLPEAELRALSAVLRVESDLPDIRRRPDVLLISARQEVLRRFERERRGSARFWEIVREGAVLVSRSGLVGHAGTSSRREFPDAESAAGAYRARVREKRAQGWMEVSGEGGPAGIPRQVDRA